MKNLVATCVGISAERVDAYDETSRDIGWRTFRNHIGGEQFKELSKSNGVPLSKDWAVSFSIGKFDGRECVCMHHSSIHHFFV